MKYQISQKKKKKIFKNIAILKYYLLKYTCIN